MEVYTVFSSCDFGEHEEEELVGIHKTKKGAMIRKTKLEIKEKKEPTVYKKEFKIYPYELEW